jgi:hypothetical protein
MKWVVLLSLALAFVTQLWLCFRVARSSVPLAILTFFIGAIGAVYTLFKHRGDDETSVTRPFLANLAFSAIFFVVAWQVLLPMIEEAEALELGEPVVARSSAPASTALPSMAAPLAPPQVASEPAAVASAAVVVGPVEAFSQALKDAGLNHVVTRLPEASKLPEGVADVAMYSVSPIAAAASAPASAAGGHSAMLFVCESANACRNLAGAQMQQSGPDKRRVLQNGLLLLSTPPPASDDDDFTPAAVASTFRKLQP